MRMVGFAACRYWLHPQRFKTELCQFGPKCNRTVCFYAHSMDDLRVSVQDRLFLVIHFSCICGHASAVLTWLQCSA